MRVPFIKIHGLGNDFVVIDRRETPIAVDSALAAALADRHRGIGCDQVILLDNAADADLGMRIFNADGGEVEACGNATRAVGLLAGRAVRIATRAGILAADPMGDEVRVDMGRPGFAWEAIPLAYAMDTLAMPVAWEELDNPVAVNVGNPHVVFFVPDAAAVDLARLGPIIEHDPLFPERVNVSVAQIIDRATIRLRVWERGAGLTLACGTGACATAVAAMRRALVEGTVAVDLPGGRLTIAWGEDQRITMTGPARESFRGSFDPADFRGAS